ncbi:peroxidase 41-like [Chenopodium quinoa]|uniref:peroxidase 41-like n=1 Tax=Chenopodium quinoa TaxID=63459 RepID=UPI000B7743CC|nr:peroxidase 41-like [Chenopodium quinoa]
MAELLSSNNMMKINKFSVVLVTILLPLLVVQSKRPPSLTKDYYKKSCPRFDDVLNGIITTKQAETPTTAAAVLRVFFHDCMVDGCDGSTLVASNHLHGKAERDADINLSLPGDAFDLVTRAKTALELECPGIVSCTDILATSARNLITMTGGPFYEVPLGRKDGLVSQASRVLGNLALPNMTMTHIIDMFKIKGFTVQEMVALVGAHTIGFSHCSEFSNRIFHYSKTQPVDPKLNPKYAEGLKKLCANYTKDPTMAAFNDVMTPGKFDNMYYKNLQQGLGLLASDQAMAEDPRTKPTVDLYAANETAFFNDFAKAMLKVSIYKVRTDKDGEVRHRCDSFNK